MKVYQYIQMDHFGFGIKNECLFHTCLQQFCVCKSIKKKSIYIYMEEYNNSDVIKTHK